MEIGTPTMFCSCSRLIDEMDSMYCHGCGDVMCYDCAVDCTHCSKIYCTNCSENEGECLKCHLDTPKQKEVNKAYLMIDGEKTPIKNSDFMIHKTSLPNARDIILKLDGRTFQYSYRSIHQQIGTYSYDYFIHMEEIVEDYKVDEMDWSAYTDEDEWFDQWRSLRL